MEHSRRTEGLRALLARSDVPEDAKAVLRAHLSALSSAPSDGHRLVDPGAEADDGQVAAQEAHRLTQFAIDHASVAIYWVDEQARIVYANDEACRSLGYTRDELLALTVHDIAPRRQPDSWTGLLEQLRAQRAMRYETEHLTKAGDTFPVELVVNLVGFEGRERMCAYARDITGRRQRERELAQRRAEEAEGLRLLAALHEVTLDLSRQVSPDELCRRAVELGCARLGFGRLSIWLLDGGVEWAVGTFGVDESGRVRDERGHRLRLPPGSAMGRIARLELEVITEAGVPLGSDRGELVGHGLAVKAALRDGDTVVGCLCADDLLAAGTWADYRTELLTLYAEAVGRLYTRLRGVAALRESEERYRTLAEAVPGIIAEVDTEMRCTWLNSAGKSFFGADGIGRYAVESVAGEDGRLAIQAVQRTLDGWADVIHLEVLQRRGDREDRLLEWHGKPLRDPEGRVTGVLAVAHDITEYRAAEEALRASELLHRSTINAMDAIVHVADADLRIVLANERLFEDCARLGLDIGDPVGRSVFDVFPFLPGPVRQQYVHVMHSGEACVTEEVHRVGERTVFTETRKIPVVEDGRVTRILTVVRDISDRKRAEEALRESEERYRDVVEGTDDLITVVDARGVFTYVNHAAERMLGVTPEECVGLSAFDFIHPDDRDRTREWFSELSASRAPSGTIENKQVSRTGDLRHIQWSTRWHCTGAGDLTHVASLGRDITERKRAEEERLRLESQLQQAQRLESLGVLAGGVAHDFNNILTGIVGFTEIARDSVEPGSPADVSLRHVLSGAARAKDLVLQILAFSRRMPMAQRALVLQSHLEETLRFVRASLPATVEIESALAPDAPPVRADATQIHQVVVNLCTNAEHAMRPKGGVLTVTLATTHVNAERATQLGGLVKGLYVTLTIGDTGCGMDEATRDRAFEPFFTTKPVGEGSGLGLATSYGIVTSHGGTITVDSEVGVGSTFTIYLPAAEEAVEETDPEDGAVPGGTGRILFVDDEPGLGAVGAARLRSLGYEPTVARSSEGALDAFLADPAGFDLILTDQTMPRMAGLDLIAKIREVNAAVPIVVMTGFSSMVTPEALEELRVHCVLPKPYTKRQLAEAVRSALRR